MRWGLCGWTGTSPTECLAGERRSERFYSELLLILACRRRLNSHVVIIALSGWKNERGIPEQATRQRRCPVRVYSRTRSTGLCCEDTFVRTSGYCLGEDCHERNSIQLIYLSTVVLLSMVNSVQVRTAITTANGNGADTYLSNDGQLGNYGPTSTHGADTSLAVRRYDGTRQKLLYVRFDLTGVTGSLTGATLSFNLTGSNRTRLWGIYGLVDEALDNWPEATNKLQYRPWIHSQPTDSSLLLCH